MGAVETKKLTPEILPGAGELGIVANVSPKSIISSQFIIVPDGVVEGVVTPAVIAEQGTETILFNSKSVNGPKAPETPSI
jgi:hypothetical protein